MDIFEFDDYRKVIRDRISRLPKKGFGQLGRLADKLQVNASFISQVLAGKKELSEDQGYLAAEFFDFGEHEMGYFLLLIQRTRAGNHRLKGFYTKQIEERRRSARQIRGRVKVERELGFEEQAVYYSDYVYTAVHTLISIHGIQSADALASHLGITRGRTIEIAEWLLKTGLCKGSTQKLETGFRSTYVDRSSPLAIRHHSNWRLRGLEVMRRHSENDLFFTAPFSVSDKDYDWVRKEIGILIEQIAKRVESSEPSLMATLNLDLFRS